MKNELKAVDHFVKVEINPALITETIPSDKLQEHIHFVDGEHLRVCNCILSEVYELNLSQRAEPYIQFHQAALADLIDRIQRYAASTSNNDLMEFYRKVSGILENIISYIQQYLNKYMDHDLPIPHSYYQLLKEDIQRSCKAIEAGFKGSDVPADLLEIALRPMKVFLKNPQKISFRKAIYLQELIKDLTDLKNVSGNDKNTRFHELLFRINFNSPEYIYYCTDALDRKLNEIQGQQGKLEMLDRYLKVIKQQPIKGNYALVPDLQPVWEQMFIWIKEEYQYLLIHSQPSTEHNLPAKISGIKINTSLPVPQLAVMVKLL